MATSAKKPEDGPPTTGNAMKPRNPIPIFIASFIVLTHFTPSGTVCGHGKTMFQYEVSDDCVILTATGFVPADEAIASFRAIRNDPNVPDGLPWLMDLRQYDQNSLPIDEIQGR